jgi:hypothetical protein
MPDHVRHDSTISGRLKNSHRSLLQRETAAKKIDAGAVLVPPLSKGAGGIFHPESSYGIAAPALSRLLQAAFL